MGFACRGEAERACWRAIPCMESFISWFGILMGITLLLIGDIDWATPNFDLGMRGTPTVRSIMARVCYVVGFLLAEAYVWRTKQLTKGR